MNYCIDLILGKAFCIFIFFHFPDSRLSVLKGFHFYFCFLTWVKTENSYVMAQNVFILMFITYLCGKQNKVYLYYVRSKRIFTS